MPITACIPTAAKQDILDGVHQPGDDYFCALFTDGAVLNADSTTYSATGESGGTGYTAGAFVLPAGCPAMRERLDS
ncbi:MAG: hypothetical protein H0X25_09230 [Acidobacteriales bacterium]|nr:hypothetical protein [Terriglobales bacterium]